MALVLAIASTASPEYFWSNGFGCRVVALGDVDGNGVPDFAIGRAKGIEFTFDVCSGKNGWKLNTLRTDCMARCGDLDGDGRDDLFSSGPDGHPRAKVVSSATEKVLREFVVDARDPADTAAIEFLGPTKAGDALFLVVEWLPKISGAYDTPRRLRVFGHDGRERFSRGIARTDFSDRRKFVAGIGDVDADGTPDLLALVERARTQDRFVALSGDTGAEIYRVTAPDFVGAGTAICALGDVNGDGHVDFALSSPGADVGNNDVCGRVQIHSGKDARVLKTLQGGSEWAKFGHALASLGDVDGDGVPDLAIGVPGSRSKDKKKTRSGEVRVVSGKTWKTLYEVYGTKVEYDLGVTIAAVGDVDGDGIGDFVAGAVSMGPGDGGYVLACAGKDGKVLYELAAD